MVCPEPVEDGLDGGVGVDARAGLRQQHPQPRAFGAGLPGQVVQVDGGCLGRLEQPAQRSRTQGRVRVPALGRVLQVADEPVHGPSGGLLVRGEKAGQPAGERQRGRRDRRGHPVQCRDGRVDGVRPLPDVPVAGRPPLGRRCVLAVVAGQRRG